MRSREGGVGRTCHSPSAVPVPCPAPLRACSKWSEVLSFVDASGLDMVFGLNAAIGRQTSSPPVWNASNIEELLVYVRDKGHKLPVVECGNEVGGRAQHRQLAGSERFFTIRAGRHACLPAACKCRSTSSTAVALATSPT